MSLLNKFRKNLPIKSFEEEIIDHICDLLNTKRTFGSYLKDYGLDSYIYLSSYNGIKKQIMLDIKNCLEKFETRIKILEIQPVPCKDLFLLSFIIKCRIQEKTHSLQLSFHQQKHQFIKEVNP